MPTIHESLSTPNADLPQIRRINSSDLNWALREGWKDFLDKRGDLIVIGPCIRSSVSLPR